MLRVLPMSSYHSIYSVDACRRGPAPAHAPTTLTFHSLNKIACIVVFLGVGGYGEQHFHEPPNTATKFHPVNYLSHCHSHTKRSATTGIRRRKRWNRKCVWPPRPIEGRAWINSLCDAESRFDCLSEDCSSVWRVTNTLVVGRPFTHWVARLVTQLSYTEDQWRRRWRRRSISPLSLTSAFEVELHSLRERDPRVWSCMGAWAEFAFSFAACQAPHAHLHVWRPRLA